MADFTIQWPAGTGTKGRRPLVLDGVTYSVEARWNRAMEGWYVSVLDASGAVRITGQRVRVDYALGRRRRGLWPGVLMVRRHSGQEGQDPTIEDFATGACWLTYYGAT